MIPEVPRRLGVDFHVAAGRPQGSRRYLEDLYAAVLQRPDHPDITLLVDGDPGPAPAWAGTTRICSMGPPGRVTRLLVRAEATAERLRLTHMHYQYVAPPFARIPYVLTVHDILYETHPHLFRGRDRAWLRPLVKWSARNAALVVTDAEVTRTAILERYGLAPDRVACMPLAVDHARFAPGDADEARARIRSQFGLGDWIACVGRVEPRKNVAVVLQALARRRARGADVPVLAVAGALDPGSDETVALAHHLGLADRVHFLGPIDDADLVALYRGALCTVYPSLAEGFGLPPLEAMACGSPVLASNATSLPEVLGDAAWLLPPLDLEAWEAALDTVLTDTARRDALREAGLARAAHFTWAQTAERFVKALRAV